MPGGTSQTTNPLREREQRLARVNLDRDLVNASDAEICFAKVCLRISVGEGDDARARGQASLYPCGRVFDYDRAGRIHTEPLAREQVALRVGLPPRDIVGRH